ncbi:MFS general substrate transporter [Schizophyllum commune Tattone D]|nr:MFS general substrate transporter [Schizophyllum commune Loenen D]KAI5834531.1 MFS general substrate transporter [Schizophyllum commune Tattone D]
MTNIGPSEIEEDAPLLLHRHSAPTEDAEENEVYDVEDSPRRAEVEKALLHKLDRRMSILILIYILNYIDRNNAAAARLRGFEEDLGLQGSQFATVLSILYIGYITMQVPSNMFLNHMGRPSLYMGCCMAVWGLLSMATGLATNFYGVVVTRFFIGVSECAFFPGALFLISKWYKRNELSQRTAMLVCGSLISSAFGSLIASGILDLMEGVWGYRAWRWLFFVEGGMTVVVAIISIFVLPDFPENSSGWITPEERAVALKRMAEEADSHGPKNSTKTGQLAGLALALRDGKVWYLTLLMTFMNLSLSFNAYFPTLVSTLGYGRTTTLLLCAPPWLFATFEAFVWARHSDRAEERCKHMIMSVCLGIAGFMLAFWSMNAFLRYIAMFMMAQMYAGNIVFTAWASASVAHPPAKRAVALAFMNSVASFGNVFGSYEWPSEWGPTYRGSFILTSLTALIAIGMALAFRHHLTRLNDEAAKKELDDGDDTPGYRYML